MQFSVTQSIKAFAELGFIEAGYRHIHLDDCWAGPRNSSGYLTAEADHFPNGMKPLVDLAHSYNLSFGLYTCTGTYTCVGNRPGSYGHFDKDADVFAEWNLDWVKSDNCFTTGLDPKTEYTNFSHYLNASGRAIAFNMCEWGLNEPWTWGPAVAQSWRMSGDHTATWDSTKSIIQASAAIPAANTGTPYAWNDMVSCACKVSACR